MDSMGDRVLRLEAQMNAMAQAWLYLAAAVEMNGRIDLETMEADLRRRRWPGAPEINAEARSTVKWLCDQLDDARAARRARHSRLPRPSESGVNAAFGQVVPFARSRP